MSKVPFVAVETIQIMVRNCKPIAGPDKIAVAADVDVTKAIQDAYSTEDGAKVEVDTSSVIPGAESQVLLTVKSGKEVIDARTITVTKQVAVEPQKVPDELKATFEVTEGDPASR